MRAPGWTVATLAWILLMGGARPASASAQTLRRDRSAQPPTTTESITTASEPAANDKVGKELHANRIMGAPPRIDGRVDDEAWMAAETITDFVQEDPDNMAAPSERMAIRVAYDDRYLYVAVEMTFRGLSDIMKIASI